MVQSDTHLRSASGALRVTGNRQHVRATSLYMLCVAAVAVAFYTWWFSNHYDRTLDGTTACWIAIIASKLAYATIQYIFSNQNSEPRRTTGKGLQDGAVWGMLCGYVGLIAIVAYRFQTDGLRINGLEASIAFAAWFLFCALVQSTKNKLEDQ